MQRYSKGILIPGTIMYSLVADNQYYVLLPKVTMPLTWMQSENTRMVMLFKSDAIGSIQMQPMQPGYTSFASAVVHIGKQLLYSRY